MDIKPGQIGLDATLGYGGHTLQMLKKLDGKGHIYGLDIDPIEIKRQLSVWQTKVLEKMFLLQ